MKLTILSQKKSNSPKWALALFCSLFFFLGIYFGWKNVPGFLKSNFILLSGANIIDVLTAYNDLDDIKLDVPFKSLQSIETKRQVAIADGLLISSDEDFVKAEISQNGIKHKCKIRLKGDLPDHWSNNKISLRVKMLDSNIDGLLNFSLQRHGTRQDTGEWLFLKSLREEGLMTVDYDFVNLQLNGNNLGVYAKEGHFNYDIFEKNKKRESVIVAFDESRKWDQNDNLTDEQLGKKLLYYSQIIVRRENSVRKSNFLSEQAVIAKNLLRNFISQELKPEEVFDVELLGKFLALSRIWNADHSLHFHNINFYLNPITCKLEPIGFDGMPGFSERPNICYHLNKSPSLLWVKIALKSETISKSYSKYLMEFSSDEYLKKLKLTFSENENHFRNLIIRNLIFNDKDTIWSSYYTLFTNNLWMVLEKRLEKIRNEFVRKKPLNAFILRNGDRFTIKVKNCIEKPIEILGFNIDGESFSINSNDSAEPPTNCYLTSAKYNSDTPISDKHFWSYDVTGYYRENNQSQFLLKSKYSGTETFFLTQVSYEDFPFNKRKNTLDNKVSRLENLEYITVQDNQIFFKTGNYAINEPIHIDFGYTVNIQKGTTLFFNKESFIISKSPIKAIGTNVEPIKFTAYDELWPGLIIISSDTNSVFKHVIFEDLCGIGKTNNPFGIFSNGWNLTGGINFYNSNVNFIKCSFNNSLSEDALNIISSSFTLVDCNFSDCFSDAFDGDFVNGKIIGSRFKNIKGDGVDFSGSLCAVDDCSFKNIKDKAISVGEKSVVTVKNCEIDTVSFGVVSKDSSQTEVESGTTVKNASTAAFSAFQKKESFGPASIHVFDPKILLCKEDFLIQTNSSGLINSNAVPSTDFEVSQLYLK